MKRAISILLILFILIGHAFAEGTTYAYVTATQLNGRDRPSKRGIKEGLYDHGDRLELTGRWSKDYKWVEIVGGELPTVWVSIDYITEHYGQKLFRNDDYKTVKIRKNPVNGKITGYLKKGRTIEIDSVVMGWGHCSKGWIDLIFLEEVKNP